MDSEKYEELCTVPDTENSPLKNNSLAHKSTRENRISKSTKIINQSSEKKNCRTTYTQSRQSKRKILNQLNENSDVMDKSDHSVTYFKSYYDSFDTTLTNLETEDFFTWHRVEKQGRDGDKPEDFTEDQFFIWEPSVNINLSKTNKNLASSSNIKIKNEDKKTENRISNKKEATPKNLVKSKNTTINSRTINTSNKKVINSNSKVTIRKNVSTKQKQSPKKKSSKDVKKNLTSALDNVSVKSAEDEWNDDFVATEFQAESTKIFSSTFSEKQAKSRASIDHRLIKEVINQPRDSGIEEDSREDNTKFENPVSEKKSNKTDENPKNEESESFKEKNIDSSSIDDNHLDEKEIKKSPFKKVPLKIIGEETVTKKFKIITNKDMELKKIEEKKKIETLKTESTSTGVQVDPINEKSMSSTESESEFEDCKNADDSQCNKSDNCSSDEYYDLQDHGTDGDSEDNQNENENEKHLQSDGNERGSEDSQNYQKNEHTESDNSSMNESLIRKNELKEELKKCQSPFMMRRYNELKKSRVFEESDNDSKIKIINTSQKQNKRTLVTPSKSIKSKKTSQLKAAKLKVIPKILKQVEDDELFEEKTLVAENYNSMSSNSKQYQQQHTVNTCKDSEASENESKNYKINENSLNSNTAGRNKETTILSKIENLQNLSKSKRSDSDSIVSETTNSQTSSKSKQCDKKEKTKLHINQADDDTLSDREKSDEIGTQRDLKNIANDYKQILLSTTSKSTEDLDIAAQSQPLESPVSEDSNESENSDAEKTAINLKNQSKIKEKEKNSDSEEKDDSFKSESPKVNNIKQKARTVEESSSEEDISDSEELIVHTVDDNVNKNEDSEDKHNMSTKSKENLKKMKKLDLFNSDEDSDDSKDDIVEKNHCNSDVDIEEHKIKDISYDDLQKKDEVSLNQLKSSDDSSDKSYSKIPCTYKNNKSKSKYLSSEFDSFKTSASVSDIDKISPNSKIKNKSILKRKFAQVDSTDMNDRESETSQEIDVVHYSSENEKKDQRKIKKLRTSDIGANALDNEEVQLDEDEEENIDTLSPNSFIYTTLNTAPSENENDDSDSDQAMSYSSKQKILRLQKMNLLANDSSDSSEDEKTIENSQNTWKKDYKKEAINKNSTLSDSDSDSESEKKTDSHHFNAKLNKTQNQVKEKELDGEDDESDLEDQKNDILEYKNSKNDDSEEECTMSPKTEERLNKMKRLDLFNNDEDSDDSEDSNKDKNDCNIDVDIEERKIEDMVEENNLKQNNNTLKSQINSSDSDSLKTDSDKLKAKTKNVIKEKLTNEDVKKNEISKNSSKLSSTLVSTNNTEVDNSFDKGKDGNIESKKSKKKVIVQETQESAHSQKSILESQPMFSSLEDLREGIDEKQLNLDTESDVNANSLKNASEISTQAPIKMDKITKISELVEKENLEKNTRQSTVNVNNFSADEDIYVLEVPKAMFNENLVGKKFSFSKTTLTIGNSKYEAFQKQISPTYSCVLKNEKKALDSFTTQNIRPVATIVARRKKFIDELANVSDNEIDENIHEALFDKETENLSNENSSLNDKNTKVKETKKGTKKTKKSEEKEVLKSPEKSMKERPQKVISKKNKFDIKNFTKKTSKASATNNLEKRNKKLPQKVQASTDVTLENDDIANSENHYDNLSCSSGMVHTESIVNKTLINETAKSTTSKSNISMKSGKSPGKLKKIKSPKKDVKETEDTKVPNKNKKAEPVKKSPKSELKPLAKKRKAESQPSADANSELKQETKKKKNVAAEKKEAKPKKKAANPRKSKKNIVHQSVESAADQIRKLIAKNIKFDESLNASYNPSNYNPLDIDRIPKKPKRCESTSSSSSEDEFTHRSFQVRVKAKPEEEKSTDGSVSDVKREDKKSVKKIFFAE